uniref:VWFA domain-containing protein n=1 Tax=Acrobeloides nanus TaxID=290746 RepID=A0A914DR10_9BILA
LRSSIEVYLGFTDPSGAFFDGGLLDNPSPLLSSDVPNDVVLHANNLGNGTLNYVQIYGPRGDISYTSELVQRINCNYEYIAPTPFNCSYGVYVISTYGIDKSGQNFIRNIPVQCLSNRPPPAPPKPRCDVTEVTYDIALLLDISLRGNSLSETAWSDFKGTLATALSNYSPDGAFHINNTRLAIIGVAGPADTKLLYSFADSEGKKATDMLATVTQVQSYGQNIPSAIDVVRQLASNASLGYRQPAQYPNVRHLVIYATLNGAQTDGGDPVNDVHTLVRGGSFGFSIVAHSSLYSDSALKANLLSLASYPCLYFAIDNPTTTYIPYYINDLTCRRNPQCSDKAGGPQNFLLN